MDEKKETQESQKAEAAEKAEGAGKENTTSKPDEGQKHEEGKEGKRLSPIDEARAFNKDTTEKLRDMKEERIKIEEAVAEMAVHGKSLAGQVVKSKTEEEKWAEDAKKRYDGTGMDPTPDNSETTYG